MVMFTDSRARTVLETDDIDEPIQRPLYMCVLCCTICFTHLFKPPSNGVLNFHLLSTQLSITMPFVVGLALISLSAGSPISIEVLSTDDEKLSYSFQQEITDSSNLKSKIE